MTPATDPITIALLIILSITVALGLLLMIGVAQEEHEKDGE